MCWERRLRERSRIRPTQDSWKIYCRAGPREAQVEALRLKATGSSTHLGLQTRRGRSLPICSLPVRSRTASRENRACFAIKPVLFAGLPRIASRMSRTHRFNERLLRRARWVRHKYSFSQNRKLTATDFPLRREFRRNKMTRRSAALQLVLALSFCHVAVAQTTGTFTPTANMTAPRVFPTSTLLPNDGNVLITGGTYSLGQFSSYGAELYNPATRTFTATRGTTTVSGIATLLANDKVLITG